MSLFTSAAAARRMIPHILWQQLQLLGYERPAQATRGDTSTPSTRVPSRTKPGPLMFRQSNEAGLIGVLHFLFASIDPEHTKVNLM